MVSFENLFYDGMAILQIFIVSIMTQTSIVVDKTLNYIKNINYSEIGFTLLTYYSKTSGYIKEKITEINNDNEVLKCIGEFVNYSLRYIHAILTNRRIEPMDNKWISIGVLRIDTSSDKKGFVFQESFERIEDNRDYLMEYVEPSWTDSYIQWTDAMKQISTSDEKIKETLVTLRYEDKYIYRVCNKKSQTITDINFELSSKKFLSIDYCHSSLERPIFIDLGKNAYCIGNEILSPSFIKRCLEYNCNTSHFDMSYKLKILTDTIDTIEISSEEYIVIEKNGYSIKKIE